MGMFDTVVWDQPLVCTECGELSVGCPSIQYKCYLGGMEPNLRTFHRGALTNVPRIPRFEIEGTADQCSHCAEFPVYVLQFTRGKAVGLRSPEEGPLMKLPHGRNTDRREAADQERSRRRHKELTEKCGGRGPTFSELLRHCYLPAFRAWMHAPVMTSLLPGPSTKRCGNYLKEDGRWRRAS